LAGLSVATPDIRMLREPISIELASPPPEFSHRPPLAGARVNAQLFGDAPIDAQLFSVDSLREQVVLAGPRDVRYVLPFEKLRALVVRPFPMPAELSTSADRLTVRLEYRDRKIQLLRAAASSNDRNGLHVFCVEAEQCRRIFVPWRAILRVDVESLEPPADAAVAPPPTLTPLAPQVVLGAAMSAGRAAEVSITCALAYRLDLPLADLDVEIPQQLLDEIPASVARDHRVLPLGYVGERLRIAMSGS